MITIHPSWHKVVDTSWVRDYEGTVSQRLRVYARIQVIPADVVPTAPATIQLEFGTDPFVSYLQATRAEVDAILAASPAELFQDRWAHLWSHYMHEATLYGSSSARRY